MSVLVVGDSFSSPVGPVVKWPELLAGRLDVTVINRAVSGTGYTWRGGPGQVLNRFGRQLLLPVSNPAGVELIVFQGSCNDHPSSQEHIAASALTTYLAARHAYPNARHLIVGPQWAGPHPLNPNVQRAKEGVFDAMCGYDRDRALVDPLYGSGSGTHDQWWFPPDRLDLLGPDLFHPNAAGQRHIADLMEPHMRSMLGLS